MAIRFLKNPNVLFFIKVFKINIKKMLRQIRNDICVASEFHSKLASEVLTILFKQMWFQKSHSTNLVCKWHSLNVVLNLVP